MSELARVIDGAPSRVLPRLTDRNRGYWTGGADGRLHIRRCRDCRRWTHPPADRCPDCGGSLAAEPVSGFGRIFTFTVNHHSFGATAATPFVVAIVELDEQPGLRLPTNIFGCDPASVRCEQPVRVLFERHGEVYLPVFEPAEPR